MTYVDFIEETALPENYGDKKMHDEFKQSLSDSQYAVFLFTMWMRLRGRDVWLPEIKVAKTYADRKKNADRGDCWVATKAETFNWWGKELWEVKHRPRFEFTESFKPDLFVTEIYKWDQAKEKAVAYWNIDKYFKRVGIIYTFATRKHWYPSDVTEKKTGRRCHNHTCPGSEIKWFDLDLKEKFDE